MAGRWLAALLVSLLAACSSDVGDGGGGGAHDGAGTTPLCRPDTPDDPCRAIECTPGGDECRGVRLPDGVYAVYGCVVYEADCSLRAVPTCETIPSECHPLNTSPVACGCDGTIAQSLCLELQGRGIAPSPAPCQGEDFACGDVTCASAIEACRLVVTADGEEVGECLTPPPGSICERHGIMDCACVDLPDGATCERTAAGEVVVRQPG